MTWTATNFIHYWYSIQGCCSLLDYYGFILIKKWIMWIIRIKRGKWEGKVMYCTNYYVFWNEFFNLYDDSIVSTFSIPLWNCFWCDTSDIIFVHAQVMFIHWSKTLCHRHVTQQVILLFNNKTCPLLTFPILSCWTEYFHFWDSTNTRTAIIQRNTNVVVFHIQWCNYVWLKRIFSSPLDSTNLITKFNQSNISVVVLYTPSVLTLIPIFFKIIYSLNWNFCYTTTENTNQFIFGFFDKHFVSRSSLINTSSTMWSFCLHHMQQVTWHPCNGRIVLSTLCL